MELSLLKKVDKLWREYCNQKDNLDALNGIYIDEINGKSVFKLGKNPLIEDTVIDFSTFDLSFLNVDTDENLTELLGVTSGGIIRKITVEDIATVVEADSGVHIDEDTGRVRLGGDLLENTAIDLGAYDLSILNVLPDNNVEKLLAIDAEGKLKYKDIITGNDFITEAYNGLHTTDPNVIYLGGELLEDTMISVASFPFTVGSNYNDSYIRYQTNGSDDIANHLLNAKFTDGAKVGELTLQNDYFVVNYQGADESSEFRLNSTSLLFEVQYDTGVLSNISQTGGVLGSAFVVNNFSDTVGGGGAYLAIKGGSDADKGIIRLHTSPTGDPGANDYGGINIIYTRDLQFTNYPDTRNDGTTLKALYIDDADGSVKYGNIANISIGDFTDLNDVPTNYTGAAGDVVVVNATEDGLEFEDIITTTLSTPQEGDIIKYDFVTGEFINKRGGLDAYADNAAAVLGGLVIGDLYRTGDTLKIVHA